MYRMLLGDERCRWIPFKAKISIHDLEASLARPEGHERGYSSVRSELHIDTRARGKERVLQREEKGSVTFGGMEKRTGNGARGR